MHNSCAQTWEIHFECTVTVQIVQTGDRKWTDGLNCWFSERSRAEQIMIFGPKQILRLIGHQIQQTAKTN